MELMSDIQFKASWRLALFAALAATGLAASDQTVLVVQEGLGKVVEFDAAKPSQRVEIPVGSKPHEIALSADGSTAYVSNFGLLEADHKVGTPGNTVSVIDVARGVELRQFKISPSILAAPHGLKLRPPAGAELFTNAESGDAMVVFDASNGTIKRGFPLPPGVHNFIFSPNGFTLFAFSTDGKVFRLNSDDGRVEVKTDAVSPRGLAWTADQSSLIVSGEGELTLLNPSDLKERKRFSNLGVHQIFYPAASPDGRFILAPALMDGVVLVLDAGTGAVIRKVSTGSPLLAVFSADGHTAWISNVLVPKTMLPAGSEARPGGVVELNLDTFAVSPVPDLVDANGLAISPAARGH
jgi:DNA-binding beta-propeller fold protein YncE